MPTTHIGAEKGDFAKVVLMPGDPLRAKWIAETFLKEPRLVTSVRGILGYTGLTENGKRVSVMASGMGMPSIGIYAHELFSYYGVEAIIRVGTAGGYQPDLHLKDLVIAEGVSTNSNWMAGHGLDGGTYSAIADFSLLEEAVSSARSQHIPFHVGNVLASDTFYEADPETWKKWAKLGVLAVEMESYALYEIAVEYHKRALTLLSISDSFLSPEVLTAEERQTSLKDMIKVALATAEKFA